MDLIQKARNAVSVTVQGSNGAVVTGKLISMDENTGDAIIKANTSEGYKDILVKGAKITGTDEIQKFQKG